MRVLLVCLLLLGAGCLSSNDRAEPEAEPEPTPDPEPEERRFGQDPEPEESERVRIGSSEAGPSAPTRVPFEVVVPEPGVFDVVWTLRFTGPNVPQQQRIEGPGCTADIVISGSNADFSFSGACSDLDPGSYDFEVVLDAPSQGFEARVEASRPLNQTA